MRNCTWITVTFLFFYGFFGYAIACSEHAVKSALFNAYDSQLRPVKNQSTITYLRIRTSIYRILNIDEQDETIELLTWSSLTWTDEFLQWNASDFNGCNKITTLTKNIWMPDFVYLNTLEIKQILSDDLAYVDIYSNGTAYMTIPIHAILHCKMDITNFPFDTQQCQIVASSWSYPSTSVIVQKSNLQEDGYSMGFTVKVPNNLILEFPTLLILFASVSSGKYNFIAAIGEILGTLLRIKSYYYSRIIQINHQSSQGNPEFDTVSFISKEYNDVAYFSSFAEIHYTLILKRRPEYYIFVIFIPTFILFTLCMIGIFMPSSSEDERGEKITLGVTTLLSMAVILNITADAMPKSSKGLPLLGYYVLYEIGVCSLSTVLSTVILFTHERANRKDWNPPTIIRWISSLPSPWECARRIVNSSNKAKICKSFDQSSAYEIDQYRNDSNIENVKSSTLDSSLKSKINDTEIIARLHEIISKIDEHLKKWDISRKKRHIWAYAFMNIDLFLCIIFLVGNCTLTIVVLF